MQGGIDCAEDDRVGIWIAEWPGGSHGHSSAGARPRRSSASAGRVREHLQYQLCSRLGRRCRSTYRVLALAGRYGNDGHREACAYRNWRQVDHQLLRGAIEGAGRPARLRTRRADQGTLQYEAGGWLRGKGHKRRSKGRADGWHRCGWGRY